MGISQGNNINANCQEREVVIQPLFFYLLLKTNDTKILTFVKLF